MRAQDVHRMDTWSMGWRRGAHGGTGRTRGVQDGHVGLSCHPPALQICFLMTVNVIGQRMNLMVILHGCWLVVILTRRRRAAIARLWPKYCLFLVLFLLYQYLLCVGMPPALCVGKGRAGGGRGMEFGGLGGGWSPGTPPPLSADYPWRWSRSLPINSALIKWLYLPDFFVAPKSTNLISECPPPGRGLGGGSGRAV